MWGATEPEKSLQQTLRRQRTNSSLTSYRADEASNSHPKKGPIGIEIFPFPSDPGPEKKGKNMPYDGETTAERRGGARSTLGKAPKSFRTADGEKKKPRSAPPEKRWGNNVNVPIRVADRGSFFSFPRARWGSRWGFLWAGVR